MSQRLLLASCVLAAACGGTTSAAPPESTVNGPGSGNITVTSDRPTVDSTTGASFSLNVSFATPSSCTTTKVGACTINPCSGSSKSGNGSVAAPSAGKATFAGTGGTLDLAPQSDGNYGSERVTGQVPWQTGGSAVTFTWAHFPGNAAQPGDNYTLTSPTYIALAAGSAFAETTSTVVRTRDLTVSWTSDSAPGKLEQVAVDVNSSSVGVYCIFSAAAGEGVMRPLCSGRYSPAPETTASSPSSTRTRASTTAAAHGP